LASSPRGRSTTRCAAHGAHTRTERTVYLKRRRGRLVRARGGRMVGSRGAPRRGSSLLQFLLPRRRRRRGIWLRRWDEEGGVLAVEQLQGDAVGDRDDAASEACAMGVVDATSVLTGRCAAGSLVRERGGCVMTRPSLCSAATAPNVFLRPNWRKPMLRRQIHTTNDGQSRAFLLSGTHRSTAGATTTHKMMKTPLLMGL